MDTLEHFVQLISMIASGVFGALGLLTEYKDKVTGRITAWGKVALIGVISSAVLSIVLFSLQSSRSAVAAKRAKQDAEALTATLSRILSTAHDTVDQQQANLAESKRISKASSETLIALENGSKRSASIASGLSTSLARQSEDLDNGRRIASDLKAAVVSQQTLLRQQHDVYLNTLRPSVPLEPLSIVYELEYPMDQPKLSAYVSRLENDIPEDLRKLESPRSPILDRDEGIPLSGENESKKWRPGDAPNEGEAVKILLEDYTEFSFDEDYGGGARRLDYACVSQPRAALAIRPVLPATFKQRIELSADFKRRKIIKRVRCDNMIRTDTQTVDRTAVDLIGRRLSWETLIRDNGKRRLMTLALIFPFAPSYDPYLKYLHPDPAGNSFRMTAADLGLPSAQQ
jgi:hypothetical protein